jgi:hypothetical protein
MIIRLTGTVAKLLSVTIEAAVNAAIDPSIAWLDPTIA